MYRLSNETRKNLESSFGMSLTAFDEMSADEERKWIESRTGRKLLYGNKRRKGVIGRGNPLLARRKIRTMDDLQKKSKKLFGV
ncbi:MAG: hypothetical protein LUE29_08355 [Lachnospiraceae bacterium]|nr:hypothetical protein [Lachnospiraceae bacterium]